MSKALYLLLQVDKYCDVDGNSGLWGWSVCDAFRKKEVAISLEQEPRKASLLVSYFAQSAIDNFISSLHLSQDTQMRETLLDYCYDKRGYFGQPRETLISVDTGTSNKTIPENIRHTVNSAKALLLYEDKNDLAVITSVVKYLRNQCVGDRLWAEEPFPYKCDPIPDCKTCSQVLEFLSLIETSSFFFNSLDDNEQNWVKKRRLEGLEWLKGHRYQNVLWDYKVDTHKQSKDEVLSLFHTTCVLYCCRLYLCNEPQRIFEPSITAMFSLLKESNYPGLLPISKQDRRPHLCHTAFFICSLFQKSSTFNDDQLKLIAKSIDSISTYFLDQFSIRSQEDVEIPDLDHYSDGWSLMLRITDYVGGAKGLGLSEEDIQCLDSQAQDLKRLINEGIQQCLNINAWENYIQDGLGDFSYLWHLVYQRIIKQRQAK